MTRELGPAVPLRYVDAAGVEKVIGEAVPETEADDAGAVWFTAKLTDEGSALLGLPLGASVTFAGRATVPYVEPIAGFTVQRGSAG